MKMIYKVPLTLLLITLLVSGFIGFKYYSQNMEVAEYNNAIANPIPENYKVKSPGNTALDVIWKDLYDDFKDQQAKVDVGDDDYTTLVLRNVFTEYQMSTGSAQIRNADNMLTSVVNLTQLINMWSVSDYKKIDELKAVYVKNGLPTSFLDYIKAYIVRNDSQGRTMADRQKDDAELEKQAGLFSYDLQESAKLSDEDRRKFTLSIYTFYAYHNHIILSHQDVFYSDVRRKLSSVLPHINLYDFSNKWTKASAPITQ